MRLLRTYTAFARKVTYCVCVSTALGVIKLLRMNKYGFARKATYAIEAAYAYKVRLLCVKRLILEGLSCSFRRGDGSGVDLKC